MKRVYEPSNLGFARENRRAKNSTEQERKIWHLYLKNCQERFLRQYRFGSYILDFFCPAKNLCIEIDGGQHYKDEALKYDEERSKYLNNQGVTVLRFTNTDVDKRLFDIAEQIDFELKNR